MLAKATIQSDGGKLIVTLKGEGNGHALTFEVCDTPKVVIGRGSKADNTHADLTFTVRVANLVTVTKQPELL
jgi:hypothetical protein